MKKKLMKLAGFLLILCMAFGMIGCAEIEDDDDEVEVTIVGEWEAEMDMGSMLNEYLGSTDEEMAEYFDFANMYLTMSVEFDDDGNYKMTFPEKARLEFAEEVQEEYSKGLKLYMEAYLEAYGLSLDEYLEEEDMTWDEVVEESLDVNDLIDGFASDEEGEYELDGDKLYMDGEEDEYMVIKLGAKRMEWVEMVSDDEESMEYSEMMLPLEFKRQ